MPGAKLFRRSLSGQARLAPTDVAEPALPDIRAGPDRLRLGIERLKEASASGGLSVTVSPAFAAKWLLPRIERFQAGIPRHRRPARDQPEARRLRRAGDRHRRAVWRGQLARAQR